MTPLLRPVLGLAVVLSLGSSSVFAQEVRTPPATTTALIPAPIQNEGPIVPPAPVVKPDFEIESTQVKLLDVVEAPPMPGLPPVEGTITLTVNTVADPGLPDPPVPEPHPDALDPETMERLSELAAKHQETHIAFVSATVYDRTRTRLTCYPSGGAKKAVTAWSNLDFNHFSGFGTFEAKESDGEVRSYHLLMGIGNEDTGLRQRLFEERGIEWEEPAIPALPDGAPAFLVETENPDPDGVKLLEDLHALYRDDGKRMAELAAARQKAYEEKKAYLLANPPKPKDVTVNFWKREVRAESTTQEGGQR